VSTHCDTLQHTHCNTLHHTATHCNTLQYTATHCNTLRHTHCNTLTATRCNTLQHTATHCNTRAPQDARTAITAADLRAAPLSLSLPEASLCMHAFGANAASHNTFPDGWRHQGWLPASAVGCRNDDDTGCGFPYVRLESNVVLRSSAPMTVGTVFLVVRFPRQRSAAEAPQAGERGEVLSRMEEMECVIDVGDAVHMSTRLLPTTLLPVDHSDVPLAAGPAQELQALAVAAGATNSINTVSHSVNTPRPAGTSHGLESFSCSLLQSVAICCCFLQSVAVCCSVLQSLAVF